MPHRHFTFNTSHRKSGKGAKWDPACRNILHGKPFLWPKEFADRCSYKIPNANGTGGSHRFLINLNPTLLNVLTARSAETSVKSILSRNLYLVYS